VKFEKMDVENSHVWHEEVQQFCVKDSKSGNKLGYFYLDLHPREGKYGHAAVFPLQSSCTFSNGEKSLATVAMVANFTKPTPSAPSLLRFNEVETLYHEFGHVTHGVLSTTKFSYFSGTNVERDFVEAPSQMLENWCYEAEVLKRLSGHYKDLSKSLPEELRVQLVRSRYVNEGIKTLRQLFFGTFDMKVHTTKGAINTADVWSHLMKEVTGLDCQPNTNASASFGHIVGGYSAGYYGYLWSKVFSSDMFAFFKNNGGPLSPIVGKKYRDSILAVGGSRDSMESLVEFLGREPNSEAFLHELGLKDWFHFT